MNIRKSIKLVILVLLLFHFSPQVLEAAEDQVQEASDETTEESIEQNEDGIGESTPDEEIDNSIESEEIQSEGDTQDSNGKTDEDVNENSSNQLDKKSSDNREEISNKDKEETDKASVVRISPYSIGDSGDHVVTLKKDLVRLGFAGWGNPSPNYGVITAGVVEDFQTYYKLPVTGVANDQTRKKIAEVLAPPYKSGDRGEPVVELKEKLVGLGFATWSNPSPNYGKNTTKRVKAFQKSFGLTPDGIAGSETLKLLDHPIYFIGDSGDHIVTLKKDLVRLGFAGWGNPSPNYGVITAGVVEDFQTYYKLPVTGVANDQTRKKIAEVLAPPYKSGDRGEPVVELKEKLVALGFATWSNPSPSYGKNTTKRVKAFQKSFGLTPDGIAGSETLKLLDSPIYFIGDSGDHIVTLKKDLVRLGFAGWGNPSPNYGVITAGVVEDFQRHYKLPVTGVANDQTRKKIAEVLAPPYKSGDRGEPVVELKEKLVALGFATWSNPSPSYGKNTTKRVKAFQKAFGLTPDGIAGSETLKLLDSPIYFIGDSGDHVVTLKKDLVRLGFAGWGNPSPNYGVITAGVVEDFQRHYKLPVTGVANKSTRAKIAEVLAPPYKSGDRGEPVVELKEKLVALGFATWSNPSPNYGKNTANRVKQFQKAYSLPISGIADEITLATIEEALKSKEKTTYTKYGVSLEEALNIQMKQLQQTDKYRNDPAYISARYVDITEYGAIFSTGRVNLRTAPNFNDNVSESVNNGTKVTIQGEVKGASYAGSTKWYEITYKGKTLYVHSSLVNPNAMEATTTASVNIRAGSNTSSHIFNTIPKGTRVNIIEKGSTWHKISYDTWRNPTRTDVEYYLNPNNNDKFQHLVLSASAGVQAEELNKVLAGKGILEGLGQAFIDGGMQHAVNEIYLISHALLETGHGTSRLATGIEVGKNKSGNLTLVTNRNRSNLTEIKTTYNMFGIGAADSDPNRLGAIRAYNEGWFTPAAAVSGGAKFIGDEYIHNQYKQNTLYKMRWNPANPGYPQYATDIAWATKQVTQIKNMYDVLLSPILHFNIVNYK